MCTCHILRQVDGFTMFAIVSVGFQQLIQRLNAPFKFTTTATTKLDFPTELLYHSPTDIYKSTFSDKICMGLGTRLRNYGTLGRVNSCNSEWIYAPL